MSLFDLFVEGFSQSPKLSSNLTLTLGLLFGVTLGPLPFISEPTIHLYLVLQLLWCVLLWVRSVRVVGSQSVKRVLEGEARTAALTWFDVLRFAMVGWCCRHVFHFEVGVQVCELYCGVVALRALTKPFVYVVLRLYGGSAVATRVTGFDPSSFFSSLGWTRAAEDASSGPAWKQHGQHSRKAVTSATPRKSSLAPSVVNGETKNNNDRCVVLDEGPHFNRTARGCLLSVDE